jgi:hypothetical protein
MGKRGRYRPIGKVKREKKKKKQKQDKRCGVLVTPACDSFVSTNLAPTSLNPDKRHSSNTPNPL